MREIAAHRFFHGVENFFPQCGKMPRSFSTSWKIRAKFFHSVKKRGFAARGSTVRRPLDVDAGDFARIGRDRPQK
jgi:hypothetical protein